MMRRPNRRDRREFDVTHLIDGRYAGEATRMFEHHGIRVCHWRANMTGLAWVGHPDRPIEGPHPRSELSFAILAHEVGHHHIGKRRPRWREELLAWEFALETMQSLAVPISDRVMRRIDSSMRYALNKALRRGLRVVPPELEPFL